MNAYSFVYKINLRCYAYATQCMGPFAEMLV